jgi:Fe-S-cluster containining protein
MDAALRDRVLEVYAAVDAAVAAENPRCEASGRCCRFTEYGHTLFLSEFEAEILLETAPAYAKPVTRDFCPFQVDGLCTARESRPLGCRIYFCDPTYQDKQNAITETAVAKLKTLADEFDAGWNYSPLHVLLNSAERADQKPSRELRIALSVCTEY